MAQLSRSELVEFARDLYEQFHRYGNGLLVANGAGLLGCLSVMKDYTATGPLKGIGLFIALFAAGFVVAMAGMVAAVGGRMQMTGDAAVLTRSGRRSNSGTVAIWLFGGSASCLMAAIVIFAYRSFSL